MSNLSRFSIFGAFSALFVGIMLYVVIISIPENPIKMRYPSLAGKDAKFLIPQGWSFFTKDPKEEEVYFYKIDTTKNNIERIFVRNFQASELFGIRRDSRMISSKVSTVAGDISQTLWVEFRGNVPAYLKSSLNRKNVNAINVTLKSPSLSGLYCVELKKPVPWSWCALEKKIQMPSKIIMIDFICN